jgi:hypothetical protein
MYSRPIQISRAHYILFVDNQKQAARRYSRLRHVSGGLTVVTNLYCKAFHKYLREERSVYCETLENGWGTTGEQLFPNKAVVARK